MYRPNISREEFKKVRSALVGKGFNQLQRDRVEEIFLGDLDENNELAGIDGQELEKRLTWLREHKSKHGFSDNQIDLIEAEMKKYL